MKSQYDNINDDEIRILTACAEVKEERHGRHFLPWVLAAVVVAAAVVASLLWRPKGDEPFADGYIEEGYFEGEPLVAASAIEEAEPLTPISTWAPDTAAASFTEYAYRQINDIDLRILIPHNADAELVVGKVDSTDTSIICAVMAADIRADNGKILGAFVLKGKPLAWGLSKKGYCAIIDGQFTVGVADNSPLFEEATEKGGYFFRQYPLVDQGVLVESELKNKSFRRAICDRMGEIFIAETLTRESMHDFAQALVDLGVDNAIYLVGGLAWGFARDQEGTFASWDTYVRRAPANINYLIWRRRP